MEMTSRIKSSPPCFLMPPILLTALPFCSKTKSLWLPTICSFGIVLDRWSSVDLTLFICRSHSFPATKRKSPWIARHGSKIKGPRAWRLACFFGQTFHHHIVTGFIKSLWFSLCQSDMLPSLRQFFSNGAPRLRLLSSYSSEDCRVPRTDSTFSRQKV